MLNLRQINLCGVYTYVVQDIHDGLDFSIYGEAGYSFGIFSVKFSTDGRELVAGSSDDAIYVYDLEANKLSFRISGHDVRNSPLVFITPSFHVLNLWIS